ncbi:hypothetical protein JL39_14495 [Rhizobium sp. YS-1r]|nr:hypothetical protein JL39_14495 [Rhizobium sp. YS-1r]
MRFSALQHAGEKLLQVPLFEKQPFQAPDHLLIQHVHWDRSAFAGGLPLPGSRAAGVVAVLTAFAGRSQRHRPAAVGAIANAAQKGACRNESRRLQLGTA